ncbi:hypothetical protein [Ruegeria sp.]
MSKPTGPAQRDIAVLRSEFGDNPASELGLVIGADAHRTQLEPR